MRPLPDLLGRLGIGAKLGLLLAAFAILATGLTGYYSYSQSRNLLVNAAERELLTATQVLGRRLVVALAGVADDVRLLAQAPATRRVVQGDRNGGARDDLAETFSALLRVHPEYFQVRLIGAAHHGREVVRVDRDDGRLVRLDGPLLQEKGYYPYVFHTLELTPGQVYLSPIVINHEQGAHAGLNKPSLQVATPVAGADGQVWGVAVVNIDVNGLFDLLKADLPEDFWLYLTNERGDFLMHPEADLTFGFDRGRRVLVQDTYPAVQDLLDHKAKTVVTRGEQSVGPVPADAVAAFMRLPIGVPSEGRFVILGLSQPIQTVLAESRLLGQTTWQLVLAFSLLAVAVAALVSRAVLRPLNMLVAAAQRFSREHVMGELPLARRDEFGTLARSFGEMQTQIGAHLAELYESRSRLDHLARHDPLTGLPNRRFFTDRLEHAVATARRKGGTLAVLFIDLDCFKEINDSLGHGVGDEVLRETARLLCASVRETDTVARLGGDEFVILFDTVADPRDVALVAEKLLQRFQLPLQVADRSLVVQASMGISRYPEDGADAASLLHSADIAMYRAKHQGRNNYRFHDTPAWPAGEVPVAAPPAVE
ncbi:GGDEF domain-containing protein [Oryzomicrobium sp.]|uniref:GGDEF domain-containing protein n=1 Tax=Oryzomicrobium sp. TaxID=1911578 RepID=UPI002FE088CD